MSAHCNASESMPVVRRVEEFDHSSGRLLERVFFNHRKLVLLIFALITVVLSLQAMRMEMNASFEKMIPPHHPFIQNYLASYNFV